MATQPLDTLSVERWARLREDLRRCELRRGAWYPVLSVAQDEAVLVVRRRGVIIPLAYLEITHARPNRWTFLSREGYAVCPNCAEGVGGERRQLLVLGIRCREDHDRDPLPARLLADPHEDIAAVEFGQSQVQEDQVGPGHAPVRPLPSQERKRLHTIPHDPDAVLQLGALQGAPGQLDVARVVFDEQDVDRCRAPDHGADLKGVDRPNSRAQLVLR